MYMRLGFAVAINVDPDVLLVDEVLAVGDEAFTHKCLDKFAEFRRRGRTVLLVTHSLDLVTRFCDEALWLDGGVARAQGDPKRVIDAYLLDVAARRERDARRRRCRQRRGRHRRRARPDAVADEPADMFKADEGRWGSREAEISRVELLRRGRRSRRTSFSRATRSRSACSVRAHAAADRLRVRRRHLQRRRRLLLRHQHDIEGATSGRAERRRRGRVRHRSPRSRRRHLQARRRRAPRRTARRTTTTGCCTRSASTSRAEGHGHLPAAAPLDVLRRHPDRRGADEGTVAAAVIAGRGRGVRRRRPRARRHGRLHQRRVRSPAPRARPLPAGRPRARRRADRGASTPIAPCARTRDRSGRSTPSASAPRCCWRSRCVDAAVDLRRGHAARDHQPRFSRTCSSRAPTGAPTTSSAATSSRRAAAAWSGSTAAWVLDGHSTSDLEY